MIDTEVTGQGGSLSFCSPGLLSHREAVRGDRGPRMGSETGEDRERNKAFLEGIVLK